MFTGLTLLGWVAGLTALYLGYRWDIHRLARKERPDA